MSRDALARCALLAMLVGMPLDAQAERRAVRIDGFGDSWLEFAIGSEGCPGTTTGTTADNTLVRQLGFTFSGRASTAFLVDDYCQVAQSGTLTQQNYYYADEQGLAALFGDNPGDAITGIRYSMLDRERFDFDTPATGFQWALYSFPAGVTFVALYGLADTTLDDTSYISGSAGFVWKGSEGYDGRYFCFVGNTWIGSWNGDLSDTDSPCLRALSGTIFADGFDPRGGAD